MHPNIITYELAVYNLFLIRFLLNQSREWKIVELWDYDVDSSYECPGMSSESRKLLTVWLKLLDKRRRRRGQICAKPPEKAELAPS